MKPLRKRIKKILVIIVGFIVVGMGLVIAFASPIGKYLIEKYSVKYTGRQIKMDWVYINPFTGHVHFSNFKIYTAQGNDIFFSAEGISASITLHKILSKEYEFTGVTLDKPYGVVVIQNKHRFNFSDIVDKLKSDKKDTNASPKPPVRFDILDVNIIDGTFYLYDTLAGINYFIKKFNFKSAGMTWESKSFNSDFSFDPGIGGGHVKGQFAMNVETLDYNYHFNFQRFDLAIIGQYLRSIENYGSFSANMDADILAKGNFKDAEKVDTRGRVSINDFHFGKDKNEDYVSFDTLLLAMNEINPKQHLYNIDSLKLTHPYFKYEKYDYLDNVETMFGKKVSNVTAVKSDKEQFNLIVTLARYLVNISKNFFKSAYKINTLAVNRADLKFNDYSLNERFSIEASPLYLKVDSIDKKKGMVNVLLTSGIKPYGDLKITASIDPRDSESFTLNYFFEKIPLSVFNPYLISYTSFPLGSGTIELNGKWIVKQGMIQSENHILMVDPFLAKRMKNRGIKWIPMWLVMAFVRDNGDAIDYQVPITGNLKSPTFHLSNVFFSILSNIFSKPPGTPYRFKVKQLEDEINDSLALKWEMRQSNMSSRQKKFVGLVADFLATTPNASIVIYPEQYELKEKEYILLYEAKKKYYLSIHPEVSKSFTEKDSECVDKMSVKDSSFVRYLNKHTRNRLLFTVQDKCSVIVDTAFVNMKFYELNRARRNVFMSYFKARGVANRVKFFAPKNYVPYNGFSFYRVVYKGEYPEYVLKALEKMNELNQEPPRKKYVKEREKIRSI